MDLWNEDGGTSSEWAYKNVPPGCDALDRQYMLGESLLVAPVFSADGMVDYYLPEGRWTNFPSGKVMEGGRWVRERHAYLSLPLLARPNSIVPVGAVEDRPDYADGVLYHVFELEDGTVAAARVPGLDGRIETTVEARRTGARIEVSVQGATKPWSVLLHGTSAVQSVEGGAAQEEPLGTRLVPAEGIDHLVARL